MGVAPVAFQQAVGTAPCPSLGPVPACYVVILCYALTAVSSLVAANFRVAVFSVGIIPLFGLALFGSGMEVFGHHVCPGAENGVPLCFYSLVIAVGLIAAFSIVRFYDQTSQFVPDKRHSPLKKTP